MTVNYTSLLKLGQPVTGTESGTWGDVVNLQITALLDQAIAGTVSLTSMTNADYTLTNGNGNAANEARYMAILVPSSLTLTAARNIIVPTASKMYLVQNSTTGGFAVTVKTVSGSGISVPNGSRLLLYCDGTNVVDAFSYISGSVIGVTQSAGDNSTKLATTAYADSAATALARPSLTSITAAANTPSANGMRFTINAQTIDFRNVTLATGGVVTRTVSAAINADVVSGATLGTANGVSERIAVLAIDATSLGGGVEVAVVNARGTTILDEAQLISTTALSGTSNSANTIYSASARTNVPFRVVGFVDSTQTTAGTWASAPTQIQGAGGGAKMPRSGKLVNVQKFTGNGTYTRSTGATWGVIRGQGGGGAGGGAAASTASGGFGGSGGAYVELLVTALPASASVTIGPGGTGVTGGTGNSGSSTTVGSIFTAAGGAGGRGQAVLQAAGGNGGGNGGGQGGTGDNAVGGAAAANTGGGGGGASNNVTASTVTGGAGGSGWVVIEEYA